MAGTTHRANCANAQNPGCVCSGCGGALHGWQGWTQLASDTQSTRDDRRHQIEGKIERNRRTGALSFNSRNRQASVDLARLDITDYLAATSPALSPNDPADPAISSDLGRLSALGKTIMADTWSEISAEIDSYVKSERTARDVKKHLADHAWCGLLVAMIRWIEQIDQVVQLLSDGGKQFVKGFLVQHLSGLSKGLAKVVVDIVVDRVWSALARLVEAHFPLLGEDTLRVLRMLALFTCPSVEQHPEVYKYAAKPLMGDGLQLVSDEIKAQTAGLFTAWWRRRSPEALA
jgi:hypothetical protein